MDLVLLVQNKNFSEDGNKFSKVPRNVTEAKSFLHWQFIRIWQIE